MPHLTELTEEVQMGLLRAVGLGLSYRNAAKAVGVSIGMLNNWRKLGEDPANGYYHDFVVALDKCRAIGIQSHLENIIAAGAEDWRASAWWLERAGPETFVPREKRKMEIAGADGGPLVVQVVSLADDTDT